MLAVSLGFASVSLKDVTFTDTCVRPRIRAFVPRRKKPCDPINQPSRCNTQEGLLSVAQTGDSDLLGGRAHRTANWASFICSMLHMGYKVIGYTFAKHSFCYKLRGLLFKFKAILLVQTARAFFKLRRPRAFDWVHIDWLAPGHPMGAGNPTISRETDTQVPTPCQPQLRQPDIIKVMSQLQKPTRKI